MPANPGKTETVLRGVSASQGIAHGPVLRHIQGDIEVPSHTVEPTERAREVERFEQALLVTRRQLQELMTQVQNVSADEARIFDAHLLVIEDPALIGETIREFEAGGLNIAACFNRVAQRYIKAFANIDDEYLRERAGDIRDVTQRVLQNLLGRQIRTLGEQAGGRVVVANDITPSAAAGLERSGILGFATDAGSKTSHAVIVARSLKVPAVVGLGDFTGRVRDGDSVLVDGYEGVVILNPEAATLRRYGAIRARHEGFEERLREANERPSVTLDGVPMTLRANIEKAADAGAVREYRADGVGLFRSEFLYLGGPGLPTEEEQFAAYSHVARELAPAPVVIRTLDLGGDKPIAGGAHLFPREENPFLGARAIRFCLEHVDIFKTQLRAILRASAAGNVHVMYPMISGADELARANRCLDECKRELRAAGIPFDEALKVGSMIEVPSAAMTADILAETCDFFSIGTNDLIQYTLAIDRLNNRVAHLYEPAHPAVLRLLKRVITEAHARKLPVCVCGEMGGDPLYVPLLFGLGVDEISMAPSLIPAARFTVQAMRLADARALAGRALDMTSPKEIHALCEAFHRERTGCARGGA
ncbi:MAG: phosphoenolpyruvate--protein phosphotransferase [Opitutaceae bacterium]|jgi:phosphotransferase system enzyme I (PtsI)|nr:phosphoenolpyruvate--protein phosphotransferase [Opitutaceae bacterium]